LRTRGLRPVAGLRSGGRGLAPRGSLAGRSPPCTDTGSGWGAATRAHFGAYFNGPGTSGSRSRMLILPLHATPYARRSTSPGNQPPSPWPLTPFETQNFGTDYAHSLCAQAVPPRPNRPGAMEHAAGSDAADATQVHTRGRRGRRRHPTMRTPPCLKARQSAHTFGRDGRPAVIPDAHFVLLLPWCAWGQSFRNRSRERLTGM
jgi:hypothetical protein